MAKTLPAITVSDAQYARVAAAIPGTTAAQKLANYEQLVRRTLTRMVVEADIRAAEAAAAAAVEAAREAAMSNPDNL